MSPPKHLLYYVLIAKAGHKLQYAIRLHSEKLKGYNVNSTVGEVHLCQVPPGNSSLLRDTNNAGCAWNGQIDVVSRLVLGFDPRIEHVPFVRHMITNPLPNQPTVADQLRGLQYIINWPTMTLQDAVDFA